MAERWLKERGAWVLARAGRHRGARRRGELLVSAARRHERSEAGLGEAAFGEVTTPNIIHRSIFREEGAANTLGWAWWTLTWVLWSLLLLGPAWVMAWGLYSVWCARAAHWGPPRLAPPLAASVTAAVLSTGYWAALRPEGLLTQLVVGYGLVQVIAAPAHLGWLSRAYGWPAVEKTLRARSTDIAPVAVPEIKTDEPVHITVPEADIDTAEIPVVAEASPSDTTTSTENEVVTEVAQSDYTDEPVYGEDEQYPDDDLSPVITVEIDSAYQKGSAR